MTRCPACRSERIEPAYPDYAGTCITSDMMVLKDARIENGMCLGCGLIFNGAGTRGFTENFYRNSYSLMLHDERAALQNFSTGAAVSQAERTYQILRESIDLPLSGRIVEAGAGKGEFLGHFAKDLPGWRMAAFEPSAAYDVLVKRLPEVDAARADYTSYPLEPESLDLVVALGVLEHVENPLEAMRWAAGGLKTGGHFYLRVPNFAKNPNDLFCVDHLSKLTVPSLKSLAAASGFESVAVKESGVPVFMALRKTGAAGGTLVSAVTENRPILQSNVAVARGSMDALMAARGRAAETGTRFAIFGLGSSGLFSPFYCHFAADEIAAYVDENRSMWGSRIHGRPVVGLDGIGALGIKHIALAISPAYYDQVIAKLKPLGIEIYAGDSQPGAILRVHHS